MAYILQIFFKPQREIIFHNLVKGERLGVWSHKDVVYSTASVNQIGVCFLLHPPLQLWALLRLRPSQGAASVRDRSRSVTYNGSHCLLLQCELLIPGREYLLPPGPGLSLPILQRPLPSSFLEDSVDTFWAFLPPCLSAVFWSHRTAFRILAP